jgi:hypothetical protein
MPLGLGRLHSQPRIVFPLDEDTTPLGMLRYTLTGSDRSPSSNSVADGGRRRGRGRPPQKVERGPSDDTPRTDTGDTPREPGTARSAAASLLGAPACGEIDFSHFHVPTWRVPSDDTWQLLCDDQPWSTGTVRQLQAAQLHARLTHPGDGSGGKGSEGERRKMQLEALHGLWELAVNPSHQGEIPMATLNHLVHLITRGGACGEGLTPEGSSLGNQKYRTLCEWGGRLASL